jgi:hypothetical protein
MAKTVVAAIGAVLIFIALIVARTSRSRMLVKFKNLDEQDAFYGVARWASEQLSLRPGDVRVRTSLNLWSYNLSWRGRIPTEELNFLSPFIDLMIEGKGPRPNLPAEYEDSRPETLRRFKERMQSEGLWPQNS